MNDKPKTARSYRGSIIDDNAVISLNIKWLGQIIFLAGVIVYGYWRIESRLADLEDKVTLADKQIGDLLNKHIVEERIEREELAEKVAFYEKEFNINPLSWGKKKKGK
tara:strand:+ start:346 stop:669 length:324 start_codon:yes stop_codon:yes gene_type:complete